MRNTSRFMLAALFLLLFIPRLSAQLLPDEDGVYFRVIDTGAGLATLIKIQSNTKPNTSIKKHERYFLVFDTGHWNTDDEVSQEILNHIPQDEQIDLMFLSHTDADHNAAADEILAGRVVDTVIRTGHQRPNNGTWAKMQKAIRDATAKNGTRDVDMRYDQLTHGTMWRFGDARLYILSGFSEPPSDWTFGFPEGHRNYVSRVRNSISLVVRLEYKGKSILITGDAVGRKDNTPPDSPTLATEKYLIDNSAARPIASDILIAPHHGSDNGSSKAFIEAVSPKWVVFSAGHDHGHPKFSVVERYRDFLNPDPVLLTTDLGDTDEGKHGWATGTCEDEAGDDGITFLIVKRNGDWTIIADQDDGGPVSCN